MDSSEDFREWRPDEWFDKFVLSCVPPAARRDFLTAFRPLTDELSGQVRDALFAGVKLPFHYTRATGWMRGQFRRRCDLPPDATFAQRAAYLAEKLDRPDGDVVMLVYQQLTVYATTWGAFLAHYGRGHLDFFESAMVCHPRSRETVLFWEGYGPSLGKRGHRTLPCPRWPSGVGAEHYRPHQ